MPSAAPKMSAFAVSQLSELGEALRGHRQRLKVSATTTAEAAGMSRTTLHRIEHGAPSVTMGAYLNAITALGLELRLVDPNDPTPSDADALPDVIRVGDYPELSKLAWQRKADAPLTPKEALNLYERNWRHVDQAAMTERERAFVARLVRVVGKGRKLV